MRCKACQGFITAEQPPGPGDQPYHEHCPPIEHHYITRCNLCGREKLGTDCSQCDDLGGSAWLECQLVDLFKETVRLKERIKELEVENQLHRLGAGINVLPNSK